MNSGLMKPSPELAAMIASKASPEMRPLLLAWCTELLAIRNSDASNQEKVQRAFIATRDAKAVWPVVKEMAAEAKRFGWQMRGWVSRLGLTSAAASTLLFGNQCSGIAALGGAISVPLWIVFGAGASFIGILIDEIRANG